MNHRKLLIVLGILAVLALGIVVTYAQEVDCDITWHTVVFGTITDQGTDFVTLEAQFNPDLSRYDAQIETDGDDICRNWSNTDEYSVGGPTVDSFGDVTCGQPQFGEPDFSINFVVSTGDSVNSFYLSDPAPFTITINFEPVDGCDTGGGDLTRPLASADVHGQFGMFDYAFVQDSDPDWQSTDLYHVYAFSNKAEAKVHAVAPGTVTNVLPWIPEYCPALLAQSNGTIFQACYVVIPEVVTQEIQSYLFSWEIVNLSLITITDDDDPTNFFTYLVGDATVQVGDKVVAGCILGRTIQLKNPTPFLLGSITAGLAGGVGTGGVSGTISFAGTLDLRELLTDTSMTIVANGNTSDNEPVPLLARLALEPDDTNCKTETLAACVNADGDFGNLNNWLHNDGVQPINGGGVSIPPRNSISQGSIVVDEMTTYTLTVQARDVGAGGDDPSVLRMLVDLQYQDVTLDPEWRNYSFTPPDPVINPEAIGLGNQGPLDDIEIRYACLAPNTVSVTPGSCYFSNHEFDADGLDWSASSTTFANGQAYITDGGTIAQAVRLLPNDDSSSHEYTVSAQVRLLASGDYTGQVGKSVDLQYKYPDSGDYAELGTIDSALVLSQGLNPADGTVQHDYPYKFSTTFTISEDTNTPFTFQVSVTDSDGYLKGMRIDWVCIEGTFPGQGGGGYTPPFIPRCAVVPTPEDNSIGPWIYYHWKNLQKFFECDLMVLLNKWHQEFYQFTVTARLVMRYWIATVHFGARWLGNVFYWLNGSFRNIAVGNVTTIIDSGGGCHDIFCAIGDLIGGLNPIIDALANAINNLVAILLSGASFFFTILGGVITFILALIVKLFAFIQSAAALLGGLITAYNTATPTAIPGLPTCASDPDSSILCRGLWVLDNTIFAGRWGVLFTIILSILGIHLILWAMGEFRNIILKMGSAA